MAPLESKDNNVICRCGYSGCTTSFAIVRTQTESREASKINNALRQRRRLVRDRKQLPHIRAQAVKDIQAMERTMKIIGS